MPSGLPQGGRHGIVARSTQVKEVRPDRPHRTSAGTTAPWKEVDVTAVKKATPAKSSATTTRSAKATGATKASSRAVATKPARAASATTKAGKPVHTNHSAPTLNAKSANSSAAKPLVKPAPKPAAKSAHKSSAESVAKSVGTPAKKSPKTTKTTKATVPAKRIDHPKPQAPSAKKVAPAKKAASVNSTTKSSSTTGAPPAKKAAVVGPYAKEPKFLEEQRVLLLDDRGIYKGQAEDLQAEADSLAEEREPGDVQFDEESGEGGTVTVDRERDLALSAQALLAVEEIDDALRKIERKTYGACERCHEAIPKARLRALPFARLCVACKSGGLSRR
jgi:DnaK suppressor protein